MTASLIASLRHPRRWAILLGIALMIALTPEPTVTPPESHLEEVLRRDFVSIHTRNSPTTYYEGRQGPTGFEYELMRRFADHLGVSLTLDASHHLDSILETVTQEGDLGAAALPLTLDRDGIVFSRPILAMQPLLVYRRGLPPPQEVEDILDLNIGVLSGSGADQALHDLQIEHPELSWEATVELEVADLLARVEDGELDAAVIYEHQFRLNHLFFPEVEDGFTLGKPISMAWAFPTGRGLGLVDAANHFIETLHQNGELETLMTRYFGQDDYLEYVGARTFITQARERLPRYAELFREAARATGFDWKLLAAVGYQESHWDPQATSPTGVRGLMMLTLPTAGELGVENRLDPAQSIHGGARYLRSLVERLPDSIRGDDRLYMAMAAYNVGLGHLYDARKIAKMRGDNPDLWADVREALPLLQERQWYSKTRHGYARGGEPVLYVRNIRRYYDVLTYVDRSQQQFPLLGISASTVNEG